MELLDDVIWLIVDAMLVWKAVTIAIATYKFASLVISKFKAVATFINTVAIKAYINFNTFILNTLIPTLTTFATTIKTNIVNALKYLQTSLQNTITWLKTTESGMIALKIAAAGLAIMGFMVAADAAKNLFTNWDDMSGFERAIAILNILAGAALVAAAAVAVFHTSWSVGVAAGVIAAGIAVAYGAIEAVKAKSMDLEYHADGGLATKGSLFYAGEAGPELVTQTSGGGSTIMNMQQLEEQARMSEEQLNKLEQLTHQKITAEGVSRQYIQDLYRFFKLWKRHQEEEDIFQWHFNLWEHPLLEEILQEETFMKKLADYLLQKGYLDEAYRLYNKLLQQTKTAEVYQKAGYIMQKQKQYTVAIHLYEQADLLQADNIWTVKHLAQCYKLNDNLEKALEYYRKVEAVQPDNLDIALQIGQVLVRMENYKEALSYFYKVEYLEKNPVNAQRAIAWCSFLTGKDEEALKYCHIILQNPSSAGQDWMNTGHVYFAMRNIREAVKNYLKAQEYEKNHTNFLNVFNKDKEALLSRGLSEEDIRIVLDLLV